MKTLAKLITVVGLLVLLASANAQWGYDPMMNSGWDATMNSYNQQMDAYIQAEMQRLQGQIDNGIANAQRAFADYYRQNTGDYSTPDAQAAVLGDRLYCQHYPAQCQQAAQNSEAWSQISARGHQQRMNDIQSWGETMRGVGDTYSGILDSSHQGYMDRSQMQSEGQSNVVQGAIYGESTYVNPGNGAGYSLPVYPDPYTSYATPDGYPLSFDYTTETWYQGDGYGGWFPLAPRR